MNKEELLNGRTDITAYQMAIDEHKDYREEIIDMVNQIDRTDVLQYIYIITEDIFKEIGGVVYE